MKVSDLKDELRARGLLLRGLKRDLVEQLNAALEIEVSANGDELDVITTTIIISVLDGAL